MKNRDIKYRFRGSMKANQVHRVRTKYYRHETKEILNKIKKDLTNA